MSTRCQIRTIEGNKEDNGQFSEDVTLYHHCDGVAHWMVPLFYKAYQFGITPFVPDWKKNEQNAVPTDGYQWQAFRAGYAASFLCHIDPRGFVPESGHQLHGDIAFYYKLYVGGKTVKGQEHKQWELEIYKAKIRRKAAPILKRVLNKTPLCDLIDDAGQLKADILAEIKQKISAASKELK
jgi:hypothetical protein